MTDFLPHPRGPSFRLSFFCSVTIAAWFVSSSMLAVFFLHVTHHISFLEVLLPYDPSCPLDLWFFCYHYFFFKHIQMCFAAVPSPIDHFFCIFGSYATITSFLPTYRCALHTFYDSCVPLPVASFRN